MQPVCWEICINREGKWFWVLRNRIGDIRRISDTVFDDFSGCHDDARAHGCKVGVERESRAH
jgi:hypothetical protein